ncbi:MAG TPA: phosphoribosylformylglycinamidine synthase subunit PurQ [Nitrososphaera sp.]|jgi:phosphoribosylformylglycinamidine synthase subunit PurQ / glutaminase|nr:phosphoribosylformylglycinamidine synthase subunit PurQ [Nitrososphaera sp.]
MAAKIGIAVFPGSNCDRDVHHVLNNVIGVQADFIWHTKDRITGYDAMIVPGGFAFGDRLRAGIIAAHSPIVQEIKRMAKDGMPVLGICNGFQILVESGLLPGALMMNDSLHFVCRWTKVKVKNNRTPFTSQFASRQTFGIPVAHGEGRYVADQQILKDLKKKNQIVLQYSNDDPNGSTGLIAAICNEEGNVMGMMPHPERASESILVAENSNNDAITIFRSLVSNLKQKAVA